jgi:hypothetical protein
MTIRAAMIGAVLIALAATSLQLPAAAQDQSSAGAQRPNVDAILEKYVQALGGRAAYLKLTSRVSRGTTEAVDEGATGSTEIYEKAPNKYLWTGDFDGYGTVRQGFDGVAGWIAVPGSDAADLPPDRVAAMSRSVDFHRAIKLQDLYPRLVAVGRQQSGGRTVNVIEMTAADGARETWSFDDETGLLLKVVAERRTAQGTSVVETSFDDYRVVDGIKVPFTERRSEPQRTIVTRLSDVRHNVEIDDALFRRPGRRP